MDSTVDESGHRTREVLPQIVCETIGEAWLTISAQIVESGNEGSFDGQPIREIVLATLRIEQPRSADTLIERHADPERLAWMHANFTDFVGVPELGDSDSYATRLRDYASSGHNQLQWVVERLRVDPMTKSATVTTFQPLSDTTYIPCVSTLDFFVLDGSLQLAVYAHSIDFGTKGYGNLVELARVQEEIVRQLDLNVGALTMFIKSAHVYVRDIPLMRDILEARAENDNQDEL